MIERVSSSPGPGERVGDRQRAESLRSASADHASVIQTKLAVGAAGDRYEREADAIADRVVAALRLPTVQFARVGQGRAQRMTGPTPPPKPCSVADRIQRMAHIGSGGGTVDDQTEQEIAAAKRGGRPLPTAIRSRLEPVFGGDFGAIRVHEGARAGALNKRIQAKAFTTGDHIFFRDGLPDMSTRSGQHLLAHELTHTFQQGAVGPRAQRATAIQRFLDPSQAATLSKKRAELARLLQTPKGKGRAQQNRKKKIAALRDEIGALESIDQATPDPSLAQEATIVPQPIPQPIDVVGGGSEETIVNSEPDDVVTGEAEEQVESTGDLTPEVDPLVTKREELLARLGEIEAIARDEKAIRVAITRALRSAMPRGFVESRGDVDAIVRALPPQSRFSSYRSRIEALQPNEVGGAEGAIRELVDGYSDGGIRTQCERYAVYLNNATEAHVTKLVAGANDDRGMAALAGYVRSALGKRLEVGPLRSYYRSTHDREERATYGMSFDLTNSPLAVHCHTAGSGNQITSVSLKDRNLEGGKPVLSTRALGSPLEDALRDAIRKCADNPLTVVSEIKSGHRRAVRWTRRGL